MKKKLIAIVLVAAMALVAVVGATLAYFSDTDEESNVFTVGNVKIELTETKGEGISETVYPGQAFLKNPCVTNTGSNPCFVRIKITGLDQFGEDKLITYETNDESGALGEGWVLGADGYFYYTEVVTFDGDTENETLGSKTTDLFDKIRFPSALDDSDASKGGSIAVRAEAVQAQGAKEAWADVLTMTPDEIAAWFATCGMNDD